MIATITFLPTDERQTSRSQAPRARGARRARPASSPERSRLGKPVLPDQPGRDPETAGASVAGLAIGRLQRLAERAADLLGGDDPAQPAVGVDRRERRRGGAARRCRGATRAVRRCAPGGCRSRPASKTSADPLRSRGPARAPRRPASRIEQPEEALGGVGDREPGPAIAQEVLVERPLDGRVVGDRDRLGVHHVGDADPLDPARRPRSVPPCARAAEPSRKPISPSQMPENTLAAHHQEDADRDEDIGEALARASRRSWVARLRSPVTRQAIARAIRPPSSGKAGIRLKTRTRTLMLASQATHRQRAGDVGALVERHRVEEALLGAGERDAGSRAGGGDHKRHRRAGGGDPELDPGRVGCRGTAGRRRRTARA